MLIYFAYFLSTMDYFPYGSLDISYRHVYRHIQWAERSMPCHGMPTQFTLGLVHGRFESLKERNYYGYFGAYCLYHIDYMIWYDDNNIKGKMQCTTGIQLIPSHFLTITETRTGWVDGWWSSTGLSSEVASWCGFLALTPYIMNMLRWNSRKCLSRQLRYL